MIFAMRRWMDRQLHGQRMVYEDYCAYNRNLRLRGPECVMKTTRCPVRLERAFIRLVVREGDISIVESSIWNSVMQRCNFKEEEKILDGHLLL